MAMIEDGVTGLTRFRKSWRGRMVLQVQVRNRMFCEYTLSTGPSGRPTWRDARDDDVQQLVEAGWLRFTTTGRPTRKN